MNILIKLTCLVGLVIAPILGEMYNPGAHGGHGSLGKEETQTQKTEQIVGVSKIEPSPVVKQDRFASALDANGNFAYDLGKKVGISIPGMGNLVVGSNSFEKKMFSMLANSSFKVNADKSKDWLTLDRSFFHTGSSKLLDSSYEQLDNLMKLLDAYPKAQLKIGGYTDNTGTDAANYKLSSERAASVLNKLVELGISQDRLFSEGYGSKHPVCPENDTDLCRAQNRRVDVRLTAK